MEASPIVQKVQQNVEQYLLKELPKDFLFHNLEHTLHVKRQCDHLCQAHNLGQEDWELLQIAALFHDVGYCKSYEGHEEKSAELAEEFLNTISLDPTKIERVKALILATIVTHSPQNLQEQIIKDADLSGLASDNFVELNANLQHEWAVFIGRHYQPNEWYQETIDFMQEHEYYTSVARELYNGPKKKNLKKMKKLLKKQPKSEKEDKPTTIADSRSAQMMFKTALRNHIDLTNIADNKANMMLSINAIVISITMPLVASNIQDNSFLLVPASILLLTCVLSIIYATLATRPIKMDGLTSLNRLGTGQTNLFFFGNFYKMSNQEFRSGIKKVIADDDELESTIMNDLYYLGKALGNKYNRLRTCYGIFMIGITSTVATFAISFIWHLSQLPG